MVSANLHDLTGTLLKGTLYRIEAASGLSEKRALDRDVEVRYVGAFGGLRAYVIVSSGQLVYVAVEDDRS